MGTGRIPEIPFSSPRFKSRGLGWGEVKEESRAVAFILGDPEALGAHRGARDGELGDSGPLCALSPNVRLNGTALFSIAPMRYLVYVLEK